jgi:vancomycin resistance protein YoaR
VTKALEVINGLVVNPGETFSFNRTTGEPTSAKGYVPAMIFKKVNNSLKETQVMGGGMSQVSSALYAAVLLADLEVVSRSGHICMPEFLTQMGLDADVRYGEADFSFRNNLEKPVRIIAMILEDQLIVSLEGTETRDYTVELETEIVETKEFKTNYTEMTKTNPLGYKDGDVLWAGFNGYTVELYRCKYDAATGIMVSRSIEANTTYQKRDAMLVRIEADVPPTEPSVDVTEPSVDVTEPSDEVTEPSSEPTDVTVSDDNE